MNILIIIRLVVVFGYTTNLYTVEATREFDELVRGIRETVTLKHGRKLVRDPQDVVTTFIDVSLDGCIWECYAKHRCGAAEYKPVSKYCVLYRHKPGVQINDKKTPGTIAIHGFADKTSRRCGDTVCSGKETCRYSNEVFSCSIEECANPIDTSVKGNIYSVGGKYQTRCARDDTSLQCADTGQWWTLAGKQPELMCDDRTDIKHRVFTNRLGITLRCINSRMTFQRRRTGYIDFQRDWNDYKYGFGDICGAYWMGFENMYTIMEASGQRFEMGGGLKLESESTFRFIGYKEFRINNEADLYRLIIGPYTTSWSDAGDSLSALNGNAFSTFDRDNDGNSSVNCAEEFHGAWWFGGCDQPIQSHLNGKYSTDGEQKVGHGLVWKSISDADYKITFVRMRFRARPGT